MQEHDRLVTELLGSNHHGGRAVADRHEELETVLGGREADAGTDKNAVDALGECRVICHEVTISCPPLRGARFAREEPAGRRALESRTA